MCITFPELQNSDDYDSSSNDVGNNNISWPLKNVDSVIDTILKSYHAISFVP